MIPLTDDTQAIQDQKDKAIQEAAKQKQAQDLQTSNGSSDSVVGDIGGVLGGIIGAYFGGPMGAVAGFQAGQSAGKGISELGTNRGAQGLQDVAGVGKIVNMSKKPATADALTAAAPDQLVGGQ